MTHGSDPPTTAQLFEQLAAEEKDVSYRLVLYLAGMTPRSLQAFATIRDICEQHFPNRYDLQVVDIYHSPHLAKEAQIIAAPTLIRLTPEPTCRMIGNLSDRERVLAGLNLQDNRGA